MIEKMINELLLTTKRTEKISILKKYFADDPEIPKLIARCYNPFEKFYIANIKPNIAGNNNIDNNYKHLNTLLTQLSKREITGNFAREILIRYLNNHTSKYVFRIKLLKVGHQYYSNKIYYRFKACRAFQMICYLPS